VYGRGPAISRTSNDLGNLLLGEKFFIINRIRKAATARAAANAAGIRRRSSRPAQRRERHRLAAAGMLFRFHNRVAALNPGASFETFSARFAGTISGCLPHWRGARQVAAFRISVDDEELLAEEQVAEVVEVRLIRWARPYTLSRSEPRRAEVDDPVGVALLLAEGGRIERDVVIDELAE